jgi:hypothetical protein
VKGDGRGRFSRFFGFSSGSGLSVVCPMSKFKLRVENREKLARGCGGMVKDGASAPY